MARGGRSGSLNPSKMVVLGFAVAIAIGTALLMLPFATTGDGGASFRIASFTATSAICVTGLTVANTSTYWSEGGQLIIMGLVQVGGLGIMTGASLLVLAISGRIGLRGRMMARQERGSVNLGDVKSVMIAVIVFSFLAEFIVAIALAIGFWVDGGTGFGEGLWYGVFHSVSAFNNAGFDIIPEGLTIHASDWLIAVPMMVAIIIGGLGFPVWLELRRKLRTPNRWSLHLKLTLATSALLLALGWVVISMLEWNSEQTMGPLSLSDKLLVGLFSSASWRTAGFSTIDYSQVSDESLLATEMLMFVGGGTGSTAGGIKVTTFAILVLLALAEVRGREDVTAFRRRIPVAANRQALTVGFFGITLVLVGTMALMLASELSLSPALFEVVSAFGTVGLSTGITPQLSGAGDAILIALMFLGRVGPLTLAVAIALREHPARFRYPEERPLVG